MLTKFHRAIFIAIVAILPAITNAKVIINEIMYDPEGTDTGREWIELYNDGTSDVDLVTMRLNESGVNHTFKPINAPTAVLGAGKYTIVADNPEKFLLDYTNYSDLLIDSAFSLNNTGEALTIVDAEGNAIDVVTYSSEWGAGGNGNSLQRRDGVWIPGEVTLAKANITVPADESAGDSGSTSSATSTFSSTGTGSGSSSSSSSSSSTHSSQSTLTSYKPKVSLEIGIGRDRIGFINTPIQFQVNHNQDKNAGIKYLWSFGDGDASTGKKTEHTYYSSGEYNVVTNASKSGEQAVSRIKVNIREPEIIIIATNRGKLVDILLENRSGFEINVGGFEIVKNGEGGRNTFIFPQDTIINSGKAVNIMGEISGLYVENQKEKLTIYYPNGSFVAESLLEVAPDEFAKIQSENAELTKNRKKHK